MATQENTKAHRNYADAILQQFPKELDFGFCAIGQPTTRSFVVENLSSHPFTFSIDKSTFDFNPSFATIGPKSSMAITVSYTPSEANVVVSSQIVRLENLKREKVMKISAIGKFPYLKVSSKKFQFGELLYGKRGIKKLIVKNVSDVGTNFYVEKLLDDGFEDSSFSFDLMSGYIPPKSTFLIQVRYKPMNWDLYSCSHFELTCEGGNKIQIQCTGQAISQTCRLSCNFINFGEIRLGGSTNRMINIHNDSDTHCVYEFLCDNKNIFGIVDNVGIIKPKSYNRVYLNFKPQKPINYYQRIYVMIRNHQILYVDLIGNCYDLLIKPVPLNHILIRQFRSMNMPETAFEEEQHGTQQEEDGNNDSSILKIKRAFQSQLHRELFHSDSIQDQMLRVEPKIQDFGFADPSGNGISREVSVQNTSKEKLSIFWTDTAPDVFANSDGSNPQIISAFQIYPQTYTIKPGEVKQFTVTFKPKMRNNYFYQRTQLYAIPQDENLQEAMSNSMVSQKQIKKFRINSSTHSRSKSNRRDQEDAMNKTGDIDEIISSVNYEETNRTPTFEQGFECVGHSFTPGSQPFISMINVLPSNQVMFSPCGVGQSTFTSIQLVNKTDTPSFFKFEEDLQKNFEVFPKYGMISGNKFKIIMVKFTPSHPKLYEKTLNCWLNNSSDSLKIKLRGYCCKPLLEIENGGQIFFPPYYTGVFSKQKVIFHNKSRVSLQYNVKVPRKFEEEIFFDPFTALLKPNQTAQIICSMIPLKKRKYRVKVPVEYWGNETQGEIDQTQVEIFGEGGDGSLSILPKRIDFGIIKAHFQKTTQITIENHSHITFFAELDIRPLDDTVKFDAQTKRMIKEVFSMDFQEGLITGHSKVEVNITFKPNDICDLNFKLVCIAKENVPRGMIISNSKVLLSEKSSIEITAQGKFPVAKIVDIRNDTLSVSQLWENFKIEDINQKLLSKLCGEEEGYKDFNDDDSRMHDSQKPKKTNLDRYFWDFGFLQNKTKMEPRKIVVTIQNVGGTDLDWSFKFPNDNQVRAEPWADPGEQSEKSAIEKMILDKKIFEVRPRSGNLKPNEKQNILLFYSPKLDEEMYNKKSTKEPEQKHELRVNFFILNGQVLHLKFQGRTLAHLQGQLQFRKQMYQIPALPIGMKLPMMIPIQMENVGSSNIRYDINSNQIAQNNRVNGDAMVFDVENITGRLGAGERTPLYVHFRPSEAKEYNFHLSVRTFDFVNELETREIFLRGYGYVATAEELQSIGETGYLSLPSSGVKLEEQLSPIPTFKRCNPDEHSPKAYFSIEELDFGAIAEGTSVSRVFILFNDSTTSSLNFKFQENKIKCKDDITITPESGDLDPGKFVEIKIKLKAHFFPSIYEGEIQCRIAWLNIDSEPPKKNTMVKNNAPSSRSFFTNKSSDYKNGEDQYSGYVQENIQIRIRKSALIEFEKQESSKELRLVKADKKELDFDGFLIHNVNSTIFRQILSSSKVEDLINDLNDQGPRLYCQLDTDNPVDVNLTGLTDMFSDVPEDNLNDNDEANIKDSAVGNQSKTEEFADSQDQKSKQGIRSRQQSVQKTPKNISANVSVKNEIQGIEKSVGQINEPEEENSFEDADEPSLEIQEKSRDEDEIKRQNSKKLQFIERVEELDESLENSKAGSSVSFHKAQLLKEEKFEQEKHNILLRDEFQDALEDIFEDVFLSIIKDTARGKNQIKDIQQKMRRSVEKIKTMNRISTPGGLFKSTSKTDLDFVKRNSIQDLNKGFQLNLLVETHN